MFKPPWRALSALALLTAIGCGDDGGTEPEGSISVSVLPTALTVTQGGSGAVTVTLTRGGGFAAPVNVTVEGLPAGVTASASPAQLTGATASATVIVVVASTVAAGAYPAIVRASATGVGAATATYTLTVTPPSTFTISAEPNVLPIAPAASGNTTVTIVRTNFTADVALTLVNPPAGITGTFTPATLTGSTLTSTLQLSVAGTVGAGGSPVFIQGAGGSVTRMTVVTVVVAASQSVTLPMAPATLTIPQGRSGQATLNATRTTSPLTSHHP